jgi:hypothetical protein
MDLETSNAVDLLDTTRYLIPSSNESPELSNACCIPRYAPGDNILDGCGHDLGAQPVVDLAASQGFGLHPIAPPGGQKNLPKSSILHLT